MEVLRYRTQYQNQLKQMRNDKVQKKLEKDKKDGEIYDDMLQERYKKHLQQQRIIMQSRLRSNNEKQQVIEEKVYSSKSTVKSN